MKILSIILILIPLVNFSQNVEPQFLLDFKESNSIQFPDAQQLSNGNIFFNKTVENRNNEYFSTIYIISGQGEIIDYQQATHRIINFKEIGVDSILTIGFEKHNEGGFVKVNLMDYELNSHSSDSVYINFDDILDAEIYKTGERVIFVTSAKYNNFLFQYLKFDLSNNSEIIPEFDILEHYYDPMPLFSGVHRNNKLILFNFPQGVHVYDSSYNLINSKFIGSGKDLFEFTSKYFQNKLFLSSNYLINQSNKKLYSISQISDTSFNIIKRDSVPSNYDNNRVGYQNGFCISNDQLYLVGTQGFETDLNRSDTSFFTISKFSDNLDLIWTKEFKRQHKLIATSIYPASPNGAIISFENEVNDSLHFVSLMKIDSSGDLTNIINFPKEKEFFKVYPNPTSGIIYIANNHIKSDLLFKLYNLNGRLILSKKLTSEKTPLNLSFLNAGIYFWGIERKNKVLSDGKILIKK
ncbi:T9SS type A sorting domain-containing protein [Salinivirga cyanobacteriivorans]